MTPKQLQPQRRCSPTKASFSGKNSERTGSLQPCFRIMGFTRDAICCRSGSALSEFFRPVRCVNESTNVCDDMVVVNRNVQYTTAKKWVLYRWHKKDAQAHHRLANGRTEGNLETRRDRAARQLPVWFSDCTSPEAYGLLSTTTSRRTLPLCIFSPYSSSMTGNSFNEIYKGNRAKMLNYVAV